ncbi:hypothetical protein Bca4012_059017 [Brassica carinata]
MPTLKETVNEVNLETGGWFLLQASEARGSTNVPEQDVEHECIKLLGERHGISLGRFLEAINRRHDIINGLKSLKCRTLIFIGDQSPFHSETLHMVTAFERKYSALKNGDRRATTCNVDTNGVLFLGVGFGLYRPIAPGVHSVRRISPELLSPEVLV